MSRSDHHGPWTEAEFLALGETKERIELIDGELVVSPSAVIPHQGIVHRLTNFLETAAEAADLAAIQDIDVRLSPRRILRPDIAVGELRWGPARADATDVVLVCEVTSPSNAASDRGTKMRYYAAAGIAWYLLVEPEMSNYRSVTLRLYRLEDEGYVEHAVAEYGEILKSDDPFPTDIPTTQLIRPRRRFE